MCVNIFINIEEIEKDLARLVKPFIIKRYPDYSKRFNLRKINSVAMNPLKFKNFKVPKGLGKELKEQ